MSHNPARKSSDKSSAARKRALRKLAKEFPEDWAKILDDQHAKASLETWDAATRRARARGRGWTELKKLHLARYIELYHEEMHGKWEDEDDGGGTRDE